jgi:hypothetical protein
MAVNRCSVTEAIAAPLGIGVASVYYLLIPLPGPLESKSGMGFPAGREGLVVES